MRATFNASFVCSPTKARKDGMSPIELSLSVNGKRTYIQLPKKCKSSDFKKLLNSKTDNDIKIYCQTILQRVNEIQTNLTVNGEPVTANRIKDFFKYGGTETSYTLGEMFRDGIKLKMDNGDCYGTIRKYQVAVKRFYKLTGMTAENDAREVRNANILTYIAKAGKELGSSSLNKEAKYMKYFFNYAFNNGKIKANPFAGVKLKKSDEEQVYLTYDEICQIRAAKITNDRLDKVRDLFLFMCFTGLEYADLINLSADDVKQNGKGQYFIRKNRMKTVGKKTGEEYISILYEDAVEIWRLYDGELPIISNQKFNKYLKELGTLCKISKNITTLTARHTYATYLLSVRLLPETIVQKMLGHTNTTQTRHYAKMLDTTVFDVNKTTGAIPTAKKEIKADIDDLDRFEELLGITPDQGDLAD